MKGWKSGTGSAVVNAAIILLSSTAPHSAGAETTIPQLKSLYGSELEVLGEVEHLDIAHGFLVVAGQHVSIAKDTKFSYNSVAVSDVSSALRMFQLGDLVAIAGKAEEPAASVMKLKDDYVPGATHIFLRGRVSAVDSALGTANIGNMVVDLTPAMSDSQSEGIEAGQIAEALGIQTSPNGRLLASHIFRASSIIGTSKTDPASIIVTSVVSPTSIIGTSKATPDSIVGTSKATPTSIIGTSKATPDPIIGTSAAAPSSIIGISKVSPDSIIGTSKASPTSIIGTSKVAPASIIGTSKATPDSIIGTSKVAPASIIGTSKAMPDSIIGTS